MIEVKRIALDDTTDEAIESLVRSINNAAWDEGNGMTPYDPGALKAYLERADTVFMACHAVHDGQRTFMGMASARLEMKPYDHELWLYVDEVDVCADQRQKGAGKAIMQALLDWAEDNDCEELWLGTEVDNDAANALYRSLDPDDEDQVVGYTWETD